MLRLCHVWGKLTTGRIHVSGSNWLCVTVCDCVWLLMQSGDSDVRWMEQTRGNAKSDVTWRWRVKAILIFIELIKQVTNTFETTFRISNKQQNLMVKNWINETKTYKLNESEKDWSNERPDLSGDLFNTVKEVAALLPPLEEEAPRPPRFGGLRWGEQAVVTYMMISCYN